MGRVHHCLHVPDLLDYFNHVEFFFHPTGSFVHYLEALGVTKAAREAPTTALVVTAVGEAVARLGIATDEAPEDVTNKHTTRFGVIDPWNSVKANLFLQLMRKFSQDRIFHQSLSSSTVWLLGLLFCRWSGLLSRDVLLSSAARCWVL